MKGATEPAKKIFVRLPPELHERLVQEARTQDVSLNQLMIIYASYGLGKSDGERKER